MAAESTIPINYTRVFVSIIVFTNYFDLLYNCL